MSVAVGRAKRRSHRLDSTRIVETLERLHFRICERFPESGLGRVCAELTESARQTAASVRRLADPDYGVRALVFAFAAAMIGGQIFVASFIDWGEVGRRADVLGLTQWLEAAVNLMLLAFAGIWFLLTVEERLKRRRALAALYELRSFAHVIDMHQLTKDPTVVLAGGPRTEHSPERRMSEFELARYLDYCTELLALTSKLGALYAEVTSDHSIMTAVNDLEELTSNLGRNIWQKIMILGELDEARVVKPAPVAPPSDAPRHGN